MLLKLLGENLFAKSMVYVLPRLRLVRYEFVEFSNMKQFLC